MIKHILVGSTVAALALGGFAVHSYGQSAQGVPTCHFLDYSYPPSIEYDTHHGVTLSFHIPTAVPSVGIPLEIDGEPNPHFDRLYALVMKGFDNRRIEKVCVDDDAPIVPPPIVSITLRHIDTTN